MAPELLNLIVRLENNAIKVTDLTKDREKNIPPEPLKFVRLDLVISELNQFLKNIKR